MLRVFQIIVLAMIAVTGIASAEIDSRFTMRTHGKTEDVVQSQYPYFNDEWLNQEVGNVDDWYNEKVAEADELKAEEIEVHYSQMITVVHHTPTFMVLKFEESEFSGGAHGTDITTYKNLDLANKKVVHLTDFFTTIEEQSGFLDMVEVYFRNEKKIELEDQLSDHGYHFDDGFSLAKEYAFLEDGLLFHYNSYEIAPYAMGQTDLIIPYFYLRLVDPEGENPIYNFIKESVKGYIGLGVKEQSQAL